MKKLCMTFLTILCVLSLCAFGAACAPDKDGTAVGLKTRNIDGVYTVVGYTAEEGVSELVIGFDKNGNEIGAIKAGAFKNNSSLVKITVASTVKKIGSGAFAGMTKLQSISLPFAGAALDKAYDAERLFGFVFGEDDSSDSVVGYTGGYAATQNYNAGSSATYYLPVTLTEVNIDCPENYKLPDYSFYGVNRLEKITFVTKNVTRGADGAVSVTDGAESKITEIGANAFENCYGLTDFTVPATVTKIGAGAFKTCTNLKGEASSEADAVFAFSSAAALTEIGEKAFLGTKFTDLSLPEGLKKIGDYAFASETENGVITEYGESNVVSAVFPSTLETLGKYAFYKAQKLKNVNFNSLNDEIALQKICEGAFQHAIALENLTFGSASSAAALELAPWAFYGCKALKAINLPSYLKILGSYSFAGCSYVDTVNLSAGIILNDGVFSACSSLVSFTGRTLTDSEKNNVFEKCPLGASFTKKADNTYMLASVDVGVLLDFTVPDTYKNAAVTEIAADAFYGRNVTKITAGKNVKTIGNGAFSNCGSLAELVLGDNVESIGKDAVKDSKLFIDSADEVYVGKYLLAVKSDASSYAVRENTVAVADNAFENKSLTSVTLPESLKFIGKETFKGCAALNELTVTAKIEKIGENAFENCDSLAKVKIKSEKIAKSFDSKSAHGGLIEEASEIYVSSQLTFGAVKNDLYKNPTSDEAGYDKYLPIT